MADNKIHISTEQPRVGDGAIKHLWARMKEWVSALVSEKVPESSEQGKFLRSDNTWAEIKHDGTISGDGASTELSVSGTVSDLHSTLTGEIEASAEETKSTLRAEMGAKAVFLTAEEWEAQKEKEGDPSKVYYVGPAESDGEDKYDVYVWRKDTSVYVQVDEASISLVGYWHGDATVTGEGNAVTSIVKNGDDTVTVTKGATFATAEELGTGLAKKQDTVADLDSIREGAGLGKTALQSESDPVFSASAASGISVSDIASWNGKQGKLKNGTGIILDEDGNISVDMSVLPKAKMDNSTIVGEGTDEDPFHAAEMTGAALDSDGKAGIVPAPTKEDVGKILSANGTWMNYPPTKDGWVSPQPSVVLQASCSR